MAGREGHQLGSALDADLGSQVGDVALDRLLGYGLKYSDGFKETHLARV